MKKLAILIFGAVLLLGACSSGSTTTANKPVAPTTTIGNSANTAEGAAQLEVAARAFGNAFINGDADTAHQLYTARCRNAVSPKDLAAFIGKASKDYSGVKLTTYSAKITGNTASVNYGMSDSSLSRQNQRWMVENGTWHNDEC